MGEPFVDGSVNAILTLVDEIDVVTAVIYAGADEGVTVNEVSEYGPKP